MRSYDFKYELVILARCLLGPAGLSCLTASYLLTTIAVTPRLWDQDLRQGQQQDFRGGHDRAAAECRQSISRLAEKMCARGGLVFNCEQMRPCAAPRVAKSGLVAV
jgi:hypothetical protein